MKRFALILIAVVFVLNPIKAFSHKMWSNGDPVPAWVKTKCCGVADSRHLRPDQVHAVEGGYKIDGYKNIVPYSTMEPSPDGEWWIFYRETDGYQSQVFCFFGPASST